MSLEWVIFNETHPNDILPYGDIKHQNRIYKLVGNKNKIYEVGEDNLK